MTASNFFVTLSPVGVLLHQTRAYEIPGYQRPYAWTEEKIDELWDDLIGPADDRKGLNEEYLLGSMVTIKKDGVYDVIDGQQRLVSMTLMYCAIRDALKKYDGVGDEKFKDGVRDLVRDLNTRIVYRDRKFIKLNDASADQLFSDICCERDVKKVTAKLYKNYTNLYERAGKLLMDLHIEKLEYGRLEDLRDIVNAVTFRVYVNEIMTTSEVDALQVFQALNARGQKLTQSDLIKSHLFGKDDSVTKDWGSVFALFSKEIKRNDKKMDDLVYDSIMSRNWKWELDNKYVSKQKMYEAVKERVKNADDVTKFVTDLARDVEIIDKLEHPRDEYSVKLKHVLHGLNQVKAVYFKRPIIAAVRCWGLEDRTTFSIIEVLLKFFFMYRTVCRMDIDELRRLARDLTDEIETGGKNVKVSDVHKKLVCKIEEMLGSQGDKKAGINAFHSRFAKQFTTRDYTDDAAKYVLISISQHRQKNFPVPAKGFDLEHVFPKKSTKEDWPDYEKLEEVKNNIGNLTLLPRPWNSKLGNYTFDVKKTGRKSNGAFIHSGKDANGNPRVVSYTESELTLNEYFARCTAWDSAEVLKRGQDLQKDAIKIWTLYEYPDEAA